MNPIDLKSLVVGRYRIAFDEAAQFEPNGKKDPWYQVIQCQRGQIYPYSDMLLAVHSKGTGTRQKLQAIDGLTVRNWTDDGEAIFTFPPSLFGRVAEIVKPRKRRVSKMTDLQKANLAEMGRKYRFSPGLNANPGVKDGRSPARPIVGAR